MNIVLFILEKVLLAIIPILLFAMITMLFIPALMFDYVIPTEKSIIHDYKEIQTCNNKSNSK